MSNMMPFIMSSPPPIDDCEEEEDDEFGDFSAADHNFSITDLNPTSDSPEIEKPWSEPPTIDKEDELPGISSNNLSNYMSKETKPELNIKPVENHIHVEDSNGFMCEISNSLCNKNENSPSDNVVVQSVITDGFSLDAQGEETNSHSIDGNKEDGKNSQEITDVEEVDGGVERTEKSNSDAENISDIRKDKLDVAGDDFSEFSDFTSGLSNFESVTVKESEGSGINSTQAEDDFDEFDDFESAVFTSCSTKEELTVEETLKMMFEHPEENGNEVATDTPELTDSLHSCLDDSSSVWGHLKELETSHALSYQWSNSAANKTLLSSLNIDCRNILFGARWNCCVPRFAANLGVNPLEPVKATESTSLPQVSSPSTSAAAEEVVPAAQFDWTTSGLTNPLDASHLTLLDLDFFTKFDDISSSSHAASSFWNHSSLEKENVGSTTEESSMPTFVDALEVNSVKPVVDDIFGSICGVDVVGKEEDESVEATILHPSISSVPVSDSRKRNEMSSEAYSIVESFPDLSFLSARKLMHAADENMSRWRLRP